jgi:hypothetical protein
LLISSTGFGHASFVEFNGLSRQRRGEDLTKRRKKFAGNKNVVQTILGLGGGGGGGGGPNITYQMKREVHIQAKTCRHKKQLSCLQKMK